jgi:hypothetical protein
MLGDPPDASPREAAEALGEIARLRGRTRRSLGMPWFPLICFGALTMLSAPLVAAAGTITLVPLWLVAGTAGMLLTRRYYRRRGDRLGVTGRGRRVWAVAVVMGILCVAGGVVSGTASGPAAGLLTPVVVVAAGYLAMGWLQRNLAASLAAVPGAVLAAALILHGAAAWAVELAFGAAMVAAGAVLRAVEARS